MRRAVLLGPALCATLWAGCHPAPPPVLPSAGLPVGILPRGPQPPVAVPTPPPDPRLEEPLFCEDDQVYVPGQWDYAGEWCWQAGYCAHGLAAGLSWVPPAYAEGRYTRGYFTAGAPPPPAGRPGYRRYVHPPEMVIAAPDPPADPAEAAPPEAAPAAAPPVYYGVPPPVYYPLPGPRAPRAERRHMK